jgi:hypothetical protein
MGDMRRLLFLLIAMTLGACGGSHDSADTSASRATTTSPGATAGEHAASSVTPCDSLSDAELSTVFGEAVTKQTTPGPGCNLTSSKANASVKFESGGSMATARSTIEKSFKTSTHNVPGVGDDAFGYTANISGIEVRGVLVEQGGRIANVSGNLDETACVALAKAMLN